MRQHTLRMKRDFFDDKDCLECCSKSQLACACTAGGGFRAAATCSEEQTSAYVSIRQNPRRRCCQCLFKDIRETRD